MARNSKALIAVSWTDGTLASFILMMIAVRTQSTSNSSFEILALLDVIQPVLLGAAMIFAGNYHSVQRETRMARA